MGSQRTNTELPILSNSGTIPGTAVAEMSDSCLHRALISPRKARHKGNKRKKSQQMGLVKEHGKEGSAVMRWTDNGSETRACHGLNTGSPAN